MGQRASKMGQNKQSRSEPDKITKSGPIQAKWRLHMSKCTGQTDQNRTIWAKACQKGPKWAKIAKKGKTSENWCKWVKTTETGGKR